VTLKSGTPYFATLAAMWSVKRSSALNVPDSVPRFYDYSPYGVR
jgi:hypothetical protein